MRCGKTVKIDYAHARRIEGSEEARTLVNELNLRVGQANRSASNSSIGSASTEVILGKVAADKDGRKGLLRTFQEDVLTKYAKKEVEVSELLRECEKAGIPSAYADKLVKQLVSSGQAYRPRIGWIRLL
jgi:hypothetical protein